MDQFQETLHVEQQKDSQKDGETLIHMIILVMARGPIKFLTSNSKYQLLTPEAQSGYTSKSSIWQKTICFSQWF